MINYTYHYLHPATTICRSKVFRHYNIHNSKTLCNTFIYCYCCFNICIQIKTAVPMTGLSKRAIMVDECAYAYVCVCGDFCEFVEFYLARSLTFRNVLAKAKFK